jgi:ribosomal protein S18 acetylase RimI-like enzyme
LAWPFEEHQLPVAIIEAAPADADEIVALQRLAFRPQAELYSVCTIPPLEETPDDVRAAVEEGTVLKAVDDDGLIVGSVRGTVHDGDTCHVARLAVLPGLQDRGIGSLLMRELEARFPRAARFELFTGHRSEKSLHLYGKLGYSRVRAEKSSEDITLVVMEKSVRKSAPLPAPEDATA